MTAIRVGSGGPDAVTEAFAVDCQVPTFFATAAQPAVLPDEGSHTRHPVGEAALLDSSITAA
ncbi:MAG: hypothetical protein ABFS37_09645 [Acidobacteriota bacterium]